MLKSCATCSYIGNDTEHICPFCKGELAVGKPKRSSGTSAFRMHQVNALMQCSRQKIEQDRNPLAGSEDRLKLIA